MRDREKERWRLGRLQLKEVLRLRVNFQHHRRVGIRQGFDQQSLCFELHRHSRLTQKFWQLLRIEVAARQNAAHFLDRHIGDSALRQGGWCCLNEQWRIEDLPNLDRDCEAAVD